MGNSDELDERSKRRRNHHRQVVAFRLAVAASAVFIIVVGAVDLTKAIGQDAKNIKKGVVEATESYFFKPEDWENAVDDFKQNYLTELDAEIEKEKKEEEGQEYPDMKDSTAPLPLLDSESDKFTEHAENTEEKEAPSVKEGTVVDVADSETLKITIAGQESRVRLLGINVPEGKDLSDFVEGMPPESTVFNEVKKKLEEEKNVTLEYGNPAYDKYGRLLAFVELPDGTVLQDWLIENGYARLEGLSETDERYNKLLELEQKARDSKAGFWNGYFTE